MTFFLTCLDRYLYFEIKIFGIYLIFNVPILLFIIFSLQYLQLNHIYKLM